MTVVVRVVVPFVALTVIVYEVRGVVEAADIVRVELFDPFGLRNMLDGETDKVRVVSFEFASSNIVPV